MRSPSSRHLVCCLINFMMLHRISVQAFQTSRQRSSCSFRARPVSRLYSAPPAEDNTSKSKKKSKESYSFPLDDPSSFPEWSFGPRDFFKYELIYQSKISNARVGRIHTPHGIIDTPGFVAVATNGALKGLDFRQADEAGQQLVFCNSYHLLLHPGPEVIEGKRVEKEKV